MPIYAFGSNGSGQLGIGHKEDVSVPTRCLFRDDIARAAAGTSIKSTTTSTTTASIAAQQQQQQQQRRLGINDEEEEEDIPVKVAAGGNHTLVLFRSGAVFAAGALGDALFDEFDREDKEGEKDEKYDPEDILRRVSFKDPISGQRIDRFKHVFATWDASFFIAFSDDKDIIYAYGIGSKGELGLGTPIMKAAQPTRIPDFPPVGLNVVAVDACMGHAALVLSDGSAFGWGASRKGQLGEGNVDAKVIWSPARITPEKGKERATGVVCGREFTVLCMEETQNKPDEKQGQLRFAFFGPEKEKDKWGTSSLKHVDPSSLPNIGSPARIAASWHNVYIHNADNSIVAWGRNDRGQIPPGCSYTDTKPTTITTTNNDNNSDDNRPSDTAIDRVESLAVGSEHVLALTSDGNVLAAGWGEHGNCGPNTDEDGDVKGRWARIEFGRDLSAGEGQREEEGEKKEVVIGLGGGCATSWILTRRGRDGL